MKLSFTLITFLFTIHSLFSQTDLLGSVFKRDYGPTVTSRQWSNNIMQTSTGELLSVGIDYFYQSSDADVMMMKFKSNGDPIWSRVLVGTFDQEAYCVSETFQKEYIIAGFRDMGVGTSSSRRAFISKTDTSGLVMWCKEIQAYSQYDGFYDLVITSDSNIVCVGRLEDRIVLYKFDTDGNLIFKKKYNGGIMGTSVVEDQNGNLIIGGKSFDSSKGYILKVDSLGNIIWSKTFTNGGQSDVKQLMLTSNNKIILAGSFNNVGTGITDCIVSMLNEDGSHLWSKFLGSNLDVYDASIAINESGNYYLMYRHTSRIDFLKIDTVGEIIWQKYTYPPYFRTVGQLSNNIVCTSDNGLLATGYISYGGAEHVSLLKMDSTGYLPCSLFDQIPNISSSFTSIWDDAFADSVYSQFTPALTNQTNFLSYLQTEIDSVRCYEDNLCSTTFSTINISSCQSYTTPSGNQTYTTNGLYTDTLTNLNGCDSIISINLTINNIDLNVNQTDTSLVVNNNIGASYQWLDCSNNFAQVPGEINEIYITSNNLNYAVEISLNNCVDTSACYAVADINEFVNLVKISPNPTTGFVKLNFENSGNYFVSIQDILGSVLEEYELKGQKDFEIIIQGEVGSYFIVIDNKDYPKSVFKIIKY